MGLLRNGVTDVNTEDPSKLDAASEALRELTDKVNLRFYTNEYQHLADGSMWLHQAWSGDIAAVGYYMPKGTSPSQVSYWWPEDGRGLIGNDTFAILKDAPHPVLAHLFLNHMLDLKEAFINFEYICYQQPLTGMTPEQIVEEELVPPNLNTTILREEQFRQGFVQGPLSAEALGLWESAWSEVKST
jgi:spermidine/putrescine transport system substrate-binding protein